MLFQIKIKKVSHWLPVLFWMCLIFLFSHQPADQSSQLSGGIARRILKMLQDVMQDASFEWDNMEHFIRKNAHFFLYLVLGVLVSRGFNKRGRHVPWYLMIGICAVYAASDEVHQLFIAGRSGQFLDVIIDSCGAAAGILGYYVHKRQVEYKKKTGNRAGYKVNG